MASTDRRSLIADQAPTGAAGRLPIYLVPDWVRVRSEDFGLLFYDTRSTRLTFVRSGDRLVPPPFTGDRRVVQVRSAGDDRAPSGLAAPDPADDPALHRLLDGLVAKGLLVSETSE